MEYLSAIQAQTERLIKELNWTNDEIEKFISSANSAISNNIIKSICKNTNKQIVVNNLESEMDNSLVTHAANYDGGFILFGGWTNIYDKTISQGTRGHKLYLAFGGVGVGGWNGSCDIELLIEGGIDHDQRRYYTPQYHYGNNDWEGYNTGFQYFHDHVVSFMFMYLPQFMQPIPIFVYFDGNSNKLGISVPDCSLSCGIGGGTVSVKS